MPLVTRQYLSSAINGLRNSPKIFNIIKRDFFNPNCVHRINKYGQGDFFQLWTVFRPVYHVTYRRVLLKLTFLDLYLTTFFGVRQFKNTFRLWGSSFFEKVQKLNLNIENAKKIEKIFFVSEIVASQIVPANCVY